MLLGSWGIRELLGVGQAVKEVIAEEWGSYSLNYGDAAVCQ